MAIQSQAAELAAQIEAALTGDAAALERLEGSAQDTAVAATALGLLHCTAKKTPPTKQMSTKPNEAGERCGSATASACACRRLGVRRDPSSMCRSSSSGTKETVRFDRMMSAALRLTYSGYACT